jgi:hypothetical protein
MPLLLQLASGTSKPNNTPNNADRRNATTLNLTLSHNRSTLAQKQKHRGCITVKKESQPHELN